MQLCCLSQYGCGRRSSAYTASTTNISGTPRCHPRRPSAACPAVGNDGGNDPGRPRDQGILGSRMMPRTFRSQPVHARPIMADASSDQGAPRLSAGAPTNACGCQGHGGQHQVAGQPTLARAMQTHGMQSSRAGSGGPMCNVSPLRLDRTDPYHARKSVLSDPAMANY